MVYGIVESYEGKITVDSTLSARTVFTIYLPITRKRGAHRPYESEELPCGTERILFIDDETAKDIGIKAFAYKPIVKLDLAKIVRKVLDDQQQEQTTGRILLINDESKIRNLKP